MQECLLEVDRPPELARPQAEALVALFALTPETWMRRMPGRETFGWPGRPELVVKRFCGGEVRDFWYERVRGEVRSSARREGENLRGLAADGIRVPRLIAWLEEPAARKHPRLGGRTGRSALVMECVAHTETLRARLEHAEPAAARRWAGLLAVFVARLHRAGWYHRDLYLQHLVLAEDDELLLLDVGRARREENPRRRWFVKDLAALWHSRPRNLSRATGLRFLRTWLRELEYDSRELRTWVGEVLVKARRLGAHAPKHVDETVPRQDRRPPA